MNADGLHTAPAVSSPVAVALSGTVADMTLPASAAAASAVVAEPRKDPDLPLQDSSTKAVAAAAVTEP